jgi:hypothetical protein
MPLVENFLYRDEFDDSSSAFLEAGAFLLDVRGAGEGDEEADAYVTDR